MKNYNITLQLIGYIYYSLDTKDIKNNSFSSLKFYI